MKVVSWCLNRFSQLYGAAKELPVMGCSLERRFYGVGIPLRYIVRTMTNGFRHRTWGRPFIRELVDGIRPVSGYVIGWRESDVLFEA
jgi:hypothetical protein